MHVTCLFALAAVVRQARFGIPSGSMRSSASACDRLRTRRTGWGKPPSHTPFPCRPNQDVEPEDHFDACLMAAVTVTVPSSHSAHNDWFPPPSSIALAGLISVHAGGRGNVSANAAPSAEIELVSVLRQH
jgi:hypothetical protein